MRHTFLSVGFWISYSWKFEQQSKRFMPYIYFSSTNCCHTWYTTGCIFNICFNVVSRVNRIEITNIECLRLNVNTSERALIFSYSIHRIQMFIIWTIYTNRFYNFNINTYYLIYKDSNLGDHISSFVQNFQCISCICCVNHSSVFVIRVGLQ